LRDEANILANDLLNGISVEAVSEEVCDMILGVGLEELGKRAGKQPWAMLSLARQLGDSRGKHRRADGMI